jgi:hypothetical protein
MAFATMLLQLESATDFVATDTNGMCKPCVDQVSFAAGKNKKLE